MGKYPDDVCPACLDMMDYCQGHGEIGDPEGFAILQEYYQNDENSAAG